MVGEESYEDEVQRRVQQHLVGLPRIDQEEVETLKGILRLVFSSEAALRSLFASIS